MAKTQIIIKERPTYTLIEISLPNGDEYTVMTDDIKSVIVVRMNEIGKDMIIKPHTGNVVQFGV